VAVPLTEGLGLGLANTTREPKRLDFVQLQKVGNLDQQFKANGERALGNDRLDHGCEADGDATITGGQTSIHPPGLSEEQAIG
jgi:hypothetical protein